ncbi:MAG TPA: BrxA/BrxB family bacilliredoxin [Saprospiraceae bacterium]|nr:BrxA/BrxB family bacilliredoxin [Saprospiraceae bacterium]
MYPIDLVMPMAQELTNMGFTSLKTEHEVDQTLSKKEGTALLVVNSVCGCAARNARPAVGMALRHSHKPDQLLTVFAGVDLASTAKAREFLLPYPPSSPAIALFKNGRLVHMIERHHIEGRTAEMIAENLTSAFDQYCN